tara:strand:+ start:116 stop:556 length:441 start_codon:yes stop_codon:yes gene_type:complete
MTHLPVIHLPAVRLEVIRLLADRLQEEMIRLLVGGQSPVEEQVPVEVVQPPEKALRLPDKKNQAEVEEVNLHYQMVNAYLLLFLLLFLQNLEEEHTVVFLKIFQTAVNLLVKVTQPPDKKQVEMKLLARKESLLKKMELVVLVLGR